MSTEFHWIAVAVVTVIASARLTRFANVDKFPPMVALRTWYENKTDPSDWSLLTICVYCMGMWMTLLVVLTGYFTTWCVAWWVIAGWLAASYLASLFVAIDKGEGGDV